MVEIAHDQPIQVRPGPIQTRNLRVESGLAACYERPHRLHPNQTEHSLGDRDVRFAFDCEVHDSHLTSRFGRSRISSGSVVGPRISARLSPVSRSGWMSRTEAAVSASVPSSPGRSRTTSSFPRPGSCSTSSECVVSNTCEPPARRTRLRIAGSCLTTDRWSDSSGSSSSTGPADLFPSSNAQSRPNQPERPVRELALVLSSGLRPPVLVARLQVPAADFILH